MNNDTTYYQKNFKNDQTAQNQKLTKAFLVYDLINQPEIDVEKAVSANLFFCIFGRCMTPLLSSFCGFI